MSLCYDFQKSMIVSLSLSAATLIIGLFFLVMKSKMDYVRGATYVLGILIIISGLYFLISASNIIGVLFGMTGLVLGIVIIWKVRKSRKQEKRLKK